MSTWYCSSNDNNVVCDDRRKEIFSFSGHFVRLKRHVEMYQWIEETETRSAVAGGNPPQ